MPAKVSILIPFYNCPYVDRAIESALQQTYPDVEVIVIDDGSSKHLPLIKPYTKHIRYIRKPNGGTASALNRGIRIAGGAYISWLSSDDVYYPDKLESQIAFMEERKAEASFSNFDLIDETGNMIKTAAAAKFSNTLELLRHMLWGNPINGCTVVVFRSLLVKFQLFNEKLPYTHDFDMWYRLLVAGTDFHFMDKSTVQYRKHVQASSVLHMEQVEREANSTRAQYEEQVIARMIELQ
jgi:glycosyltransferase involved in cell wall biosynthesis